jgi:hypothetical protein
MDTNDTPAFLSKRALKEIYCYGAIPYSSIDKFILKTK